MNIANLLLRAGRARAERPALVVGTDRVADYGALVRRVAAIAGGLGATFGLEPGSRVALVMRNCPAFVESLFACWHGGWVAVPVNAKLHPREIAFILAHSGARVCFAGSDLAPRIAALRPELPDLRAVVAVEDADYAKLAAAEPAPIATRAPEDTAWLFYTSGTTGRPKGAMLSHRNLLAMTTSYFVDVDRIAEDDCIIHAAPMSHGSGMYILPHVAAAAKQVVPASGGFEPDEVFALIETHPGASLFAAPTMVRRLVDSAAATSADSRNL
ncbi:MAG: AMP-binding protein [Bacteroidota bacterium]